MSYATSVKLSNISEDANDIYKFTLSGVNVSFANAIRRVILSEIPINVIRTENEGVNQCKIITNTSRLHNEIIKHRLSCIPVHMTDLDLLPNNYTLEVNVENTTDNVIYVTTEDFRIFRRNSEKPDEKVYLTKQQTMEIFPPDKRTNCFIDFIRLCPKIGDSITGEKLELTADFSISNAQTNSMFNVVSICSYSFTPDLLKINEKWDNVRKKLKEEDDVEFQKKNFYILDAQRIYIENSFDFIIQTIGIYSNSELVKMACSILKNKFQTVLEQLDANTIVITSSETTMDNSYDIKLENEDYTVGKALEFVLYDKFYMKEQILSFCGFKKFHPHDTYSKIRIAFKEKADTNDVVSCLKKSCNECVELFKHISSMF